MCTGASLMVLMAMDAVPFGHMQADGKIRIALLNGETRTYLEAGDEVVLRGRCEREGSASTGFGQCSGFVMAKSALAPKNQSC